MTVNAGLLTPFRIDWCPLNSDEHSNRFLISSLYKIDDELVNRKFEAILKKSNDNPWKEGGLNNTSSDEENTSIKLIHEICTKKLKEANSDFYLSEFSALY